MTKITKRNTTAVLLIVVIIAFVLRLWGIGYGLPYAYFPDEYHEILRAFQLGTGSFNIGRTGKGGYYYLLFVEYGFYFVFLKLAGIVDSARDFAMLYVSDPSAFYYIGRTTTAFIGTLNVLVVFLIARRAYSLGAGILAALFVSVNVLHVKLSHYVTVDVPMTLLASVALLFTIKIAESGTARDYKWAGLFAGLATTTKLPAILLIFPLIVAHFFHIKKTSAGYRQLILCKDLWVGGAIFAGILIVTNPGIVLWSYNTAASTLASLLTSSTDSASAMLGLAENTRRPNLFIYYLDGLRDSMGWPLMLLSLCGVVYGLWRRTAADAILLSFAIAFYLVISSTSDPYLYYPRYALPILIVMLILGGRLAYDFWPTGSVAKSSVATLLVGALIATPLYYSIISDHLLSQTDTRTLAKYWIDENLPQDAKILIAGLKIAPSSSTVPLWDSPDSIRRKIEYYRDRESKQAKYLEFELQVPREKTFTLTFFSPSNIESLEHYRAAGIQYVVVIPEALLYGRRHGQKSSQLIEDLRNSPDVTLIKTFQPVRDSRPGPSIEVYQIDAKANMVEVKS